MLCISSGTNYLWPHLLHFYFLLLFLFVSRYQDSFSKTHNHLCYRSYHPETLTAVSSVLLLNVHTWIHVLSEFTCWCLSYIYCVFVFFEWLNLSKMMAFLCRVLQKTLSKLEQVWKQVKCVKGFEKRSLFRELYEWLGKLGQIISYIVLAIEKNCNPFWSVLKRVCIRCVECVSDVLRVCCVWWAVFLFTVLKSLSLIWSQHYFTALLIFTHQHQITRWSQYPALSSLFWPVSVHQIWGFKVIWHSISCKGCVYSAGVSGVTVVTQSPLITVSKGETAELDCNLGTVTNSVAAWYKQTPGGVPQYMLRFYHGWSSVEYGSGFSAPKFTSTHSSQSDYRLIISNVDVDDSAVYYCNTWDSSVSENVSQWFTARQKPPHCSHSLLLLDNRRKARKLLHLRFMLN